MEADEARARFAAARVARLATADEEGVPHLVPVCFALDGDEIYFAVDAKPKRTRRLRRLANLRANPAVTLLADHYEDEDWTRLWWVRADGSGHELESDAPEARRALELLAARYRQYVARPAEGPVVAIAVTRWSGWSAAE